MLILRAAGLVALVALAVCLGAWLLTREQRYLGWAGRVLRFAVAIALVFLAVLLLERLIAPLV